MAEHDDVLERLKPKPNPEIVKLLEGLLQQAYKGEIRSVAFAYIRPSESMKDNWSFWAEQRDKLTLVGALTACQLFILNRTPVRVSK